MRVMGQMKDRTRGRWACVGWIVLLLLDVPLMVPFDSHSRSQTREDPAGSLCGGEGVEVLWMMVGIGLYIVRGACILADLPCAVYESA